MNKCCVCGSQGEDVESFPSIFNKNKINNYCFNCIISGFEPYQDLIDFGWEYDMFNQTFKNKILNPTLVREGKTVKQFNEDVKKKRDEESASMQS